MEALLHGGGVGGVVGCTHFQLYGQLQMYRVEIERRGADSLRCRQDREEIERDPENVIRYFAIFQFNP